MTLFLSDTHLGHTSEAKELYNFLQSRDVNERVFILGDLFDHHFTHWEAEHVLALREILKFKQITYLPGNHDGFMRQFPGTWFYEKIDVVANSLVYYTANNKKYLITHGDQYDWLIKLTHFISESWFANRLQELFKTVSKNHTSHFEKQLVKAAKERGCDGVVCGHNHSPKHEIIDSIEYFNCGSWIRYPCSYVEEIDGKFTLKFY